MSREVDWRAANDKGGCLTCGRFLVWIEQSPGRVAIHCADCTPPPDGVRVRMWSANTHGSSTGRTDRLVAEKIAAEEML